MCGREATVGYRYNTIGCVFEVGGPLSLVVSSGPDIGTPAALIDADEDGGMGRNELWNVQRLEVIALSSKVRNLCPPGSPETASVIVYFFE